eukprot:411868-Pyramimonas_sp.AAC.1
MRLLSSTSSRWALTARQPTNDARGADSTHYFARILGVHPAPGHSAENGEWRPRSRMGEWRISGNTRSGLRVHRRHPRGRQQ